MPNAAITKLIGHIDERGMLTVWLLKKLLSEPVYRESFIAEGTIKGLFLFAPTTREKQQALKSRMLGFALELRW